MIRKEQATKTKQSTDEIVEELIGGIKNQEVITYFNPTDYARLNSFLRNLVKKNISITSTELEDALSDGDVRVSIIYGNPSILYDFLESKCFTNLKEFTELCKMRQFREILKYGDNGVVNFIFGNPNIKWDFEKLVSILRTERCYELFARGNQGLVEIIMNPGLITSTSQIETLIQHSNNSTFLSGDPDVYFVVNSIIKNKFITNFEQLEKLFKDEYFYYFCRRLEKDTINKLVEKGLVNNLEDILKLASNFREINPVLSEWRDCFQVFLDRKIITSIDDLVKICEIYIIRQNLLYAEPKALKYIFDHKLVNNIDEFISIFKRSDGYSDIVFTGKGIIEHFVQNGEIKNHEDFRNFCTSQNMNYVINERDSDFVLGILTKPEWNIDLKSFKKICATNGFSDFVTSPIYDNYYNKLISNKLWNLSFEEFLNLCNNQHLVNTITSGGESIFDLLIDKKIITSFQEFEKLFGLGFDFLKDEEKIKNLEYILSILPKEKMNFQDFYKLCSDTTLATLITAEKIGNIKFFLEKVNFDLKKLLDFCKDSEFFRLVSKGDISTIEYLFNNPYLNISMKEVLGLFSEDNNFDTNLKKIIMDGNLSLLKIIVKNSSKFDDLENEADKVFDNQDIDPVTNYFNPREDLPGDVYLVDRELKERLKIMSQAERNKMSEAEKFKMVVEHMSASIFNRLNKVGNRFSGRPKNNPDTLANSASVNEQQKINLLNAGKETEYMLLERKQKEKPGRKLVLYVRQGHGEMDSLKFSAMAYMLYKYIVMEKRSPIFTDIEIVSYKQGIYPKKIHQLDIPEDKYVFASGSDFENLGLGGNFVFFTHSITTKQNRIFSTPIISQSVMQNPDKYNPNPKSEQKNAIYIPGRKYIPLQTFYDTQDVYSPQKYFEWTKKDRGRSLERSLKAMIWSVICLENQLLGEIDAANVESQKTQSKVA